MCSPIMLFYYVVKSLPIISKPKASLLYSPGWSIAYVNSPARKILKFTDFRYLQIVGRSLSRLAWVFWGDRCTFWENTGRNFLPVSAKTDFYRTYSILLAISRNYHSSYQINNIYMCWSIGRSKSYLAVFKDESRTFQWKSEENPSKQWNYLDC